ncbi:hypothetical protein CNR22_05640 [Sphingobacteriaceae bacterium]|nr:hypothetical protein CNR22_05640 [Sphingobacteriaceae bacterium]
MDLLDKIRKYESMHIVFWLIKDTCWMLELKWLGAIMMAPTLFLAGYIIYKTLGTKDAYLNAAILFWIMANSFWMMMEFFNDNAYKYYASIPFGLGFLFVGIFYWRDYQNKKTAILQQ